MRKINPLSSFYDLSDFARIGEGEFNFLREIVRVSHIEENEFFVPEIVLNASRSGSNYRLAQGQVLENTSGRVYFGEGITMIRNHADVTTINCIHDFPAIFYSQVFNLSLQTSLSH